jgi:hypothetical protein
MSVRPLHLTILVGTPPVRTFSRDVLDALTSVSIQTPATGRAGFQLAFETDRKKVVDELQAAFRHGLDPAVRVLVVATVRGAPVVLVDGVVTQHQHVPAPSGRTTLSFTGEDLTVLMDLVDRTGNVLPSGDPLTQVGTLLGPYGSLGIAPVVVPALVTTQTDPLQKEFKQTGTDFAHITTLARRTGYVFYLDPGPVPATSVAYWGPEVRVSVPQPALTTGAGRSNNVTSLSFTHATQQKSIPLVHIHGDKIAAITVPILDVTPFKPQLAGVPQPPARVTRLDEDVGHAGVAQGILRGFAQVAQAADNVTASGALDVATYGRFLRARELVGVRGASLPYDGLYYVSRVSTEFRRGSCTQSFALQRSGAFPNSPRVRV